VRGRNDHTNGDETQPHKGNVMSSHKQGTPDKTLLHQPQIDEYAPEWWSGYEENINHPTT
jgi:hypothetical protein